MDQPGHVLVVGAGLGGLRTVERLRQAGHEGRISLVGAEDHDPYDRPPLSKQVLTGEWEPGRATLVTREGLDELGVRTHLGRSAVGLAPGEVELSDGSSLHADAIVLATGLAARRLPGQPPGALTLRTLDDALVLRAALEQGSSLLVVGGGFIGAEVASAGLARGLAVTVLEALPVVAERALGPELGALAGRLMVEAGVDLRCGVSVAGFTERGVRLVDGEEVAADVTVVGIGGSPQLSFAPELDTAGGVACGPTGRVEGLDGVWAVGDVAAWADPETGEHHRHEHWTSAGDQAAVVARDVLGAPPPPPTVPYFWSDQFGCKIQLLGRPEHADTLVPLHGDGLAGGPVAGTVAALLRGDRLVAVAGFSAARKVVRYRGLLVDGADRAATLALRSTL